MPGALEGVKIVELAIWAAGPAGDGIMSDWGAEVIKIEDPAGGDPFRGFLSLGVGAEVGQHTEEILLATGHSWEDMAKLREQGVIG